jgi:uncharacterized protein (TIGR03437 family)
MNSSGKLKALARVFACVSAVGLAVVSLRFSPTALRAQGPAVSSLVSLSAASYKPIVAPESVALVTGANLVNETLEATDVDRDTPGIQLPTFFGGISLEVNGRSAGIYAVKPAEIKFLVPPDLEPGTGSVILRDERGLIKAAGEIEIRPIAPAIFTVNGRDSNFPVGFVQRVRADGRQSDEKFVLSDPDTGRIAPIPIDLGPPGEQVYLLLSITGARRVAQARDTRVLIGGQEFIPLSIVPLQEPGVEQVKLELPRTLSGRLSFLLSAIGYPASNLCELEIKPPNDLTDPNLERPQMSCPTVAPEVVAGETIDVRGSGFSIHPSEKLEVLIEDGNLKHFNAQVVGEPESNHVRVIVPVGAGSGKLLVRTPRGESRCDIKLRTSMSGIVQAAQLQGDGKYKRVGIPNVTVRVPGLPQPVRTSTDGSFVYPDVPVSNDPLVFEVDGTTVGASPSYSKETRKMPIFKERDNQYPEYIELRQPVRLAAPFGGAAQSGELISAPLAATPQDNIPCVQTREVIFDPQGSTVQLPGDSGADRLTLTVLDPGRTPADLTPANAPPEQFSSTIVQLTPFGARITPGGKLTFPNSDCLPAGSTATLFRFDQKPGSATLGKFVVAGPAIVSADGLRVETADRTVDESTYYFVSIPRATTTIYGSVLEEDDTPARGALVQVRGKSVFATTDDNGAFNLTNVPILKAEELTLEVSYLRPDGTVDRTERAGVRPEGSTLTFVSPPIVLTGRGRTRAPVILAPHFLTVEAGKTTDFNFIAYARDRQTRLRNVTLDDSSFASIARLGNDSYRLRLTPGANLSGTFRLTITATITARPIQNSSASEVIIVEVKAANNNQPIANSQSLVLDEDTLLNLTLQGSGGSSYRITSPPRRGCFIGNDPNLCLSNPSNLPHLVYKPEPNYNGADSFSFTVSNGTTTSNPAIVSLAIRPADDAPRLEVGATYTTNIGTLLNVVINGFDADAGQRLTLKDSGLPQGATLTQTTATSWLLGWTPKFDQLGNYQVNLTLSDDGAPVKSDGKTVMLVADAKWAKTSQIESRNGVQALARLGNFLFASLGNGKNYRSADDGISWFEIGPELGKVSAWAVKDNVLFAGAATGFYRSTDRGINWTRINTIRINALAVKGNSLFGGVTGGVVEDPRAFVYRSNDEGKTWERSGNRLLSLVNTLLVRNGAIFVGTALRGVYRSADDGNRWEVARELDGRIVTSLAANDEYLFAGVRGGIYRSNDNGESWRLFGSNEGLTDPTVLALVAKGQTLVAGVSRGVYRSLNNGASWERSNLGVEGYEVPALLVKDDLIFAGAGTSEGGVFRTSNEGASWTGVNNGLGDLAVNTLLAHSGALLAGTAKGLYRSIDNGASWVSLNNGLPSNQVRALAAQGSLLLAGFVGSGIYRSLDSGATWQAANKGLANPNSGNIPAAINTLLIKGELIFAGTELSGVFLSSDQGVTWRVVNKGLGTHDVRALLSKGAAIFAGVRGGLFRTVDNGETWSEITSELDEQTVSTLLTKEELLFASTEQGVFRALTPDGERWMAVNQGLGNRANPVRSLVVKGKALFAGTANGLYRSDDDGANWTPYNTGLAARSVNTLLVKDNLLFAGTSSGVYLLAETNTTWSESNLGLTNRFITTATVTADAWLVGAASGGIFRSTNAGQNWTPANTGLPPAADVRALANTSQGTLVGLADEGIYFSNDQGRSWTARNTGLTNRRVNALVAERTAVYAGTSSGVFRSFDGGTTWEAASTGLTRSQVLSLAVGGGAVYAGTDNGLFRSTDQGRTWTPVNTGLGDLYISALTVAPDGSSVIAGSSRGLFRSTDQGQNWVLVTGGLPERVVALTFAQQGRRLLTGTVNGFFLSEDNGASWRQINGGLLTLQVGALAVSGNTVMAGTRSGGVFISQLPQ